MRDERGASEQAWVGVGFEVGVGEVGDFSGMAVELDQAGARTLPAAGPALADGIGCPQGFNEGFHIGDGCRFPSFLARGRHTQLLWRIKYGVPGTQQSGR
jgi:hypothetical protein